MEEPSVAESRAVLLVEDDQELRTLFATLLEMEGLSVLQAERGDEAVTMLRLHGDRIGVVITDLSVPVLGGQNLLRSLRAVTPSVTLICTSGRTDETTRREALDAGADEFIPKPFQPPEMIARIKTRLASA
jgi:DNA-binding response OmpR family regulator